MYLVFPAPPSPTNISLVLLQAVNPPARRFRYALTDSKPRLTTSLGGVLREGQLPRLRPETNTRTCVYLLSS